ncbi:MAG: tetratricopeptide repeat protein [Bacilli bacterium]
MSNYSELILKADFENNQGNYEKAVDLYKRAAELEPDNPEVWISLGNVEPWVQKYSKDTSLAIERTYSYYAKAIKVTPKAERAKFNKVIFNNLIKQSNVLAGGILKCQNSDDSFYQIDEMVNSNRIMLTWLTNFFVSSKFDFHEMEEEQFDFVISLIDLINLNIKEYYNRVPNSDPDKDIKGVKLIFKYELLPFLKTLGCYKDKKRAIVNEIRNKIDCLRDEIEKLYNEKYMLEEEENKAGLTVELKRLKEEKRHLNFITNAKKRNELRMQIGKTQARIGMNEKKYEKEIERIVSKINCLEKQVEYLQSTINERMSLFF